MINWQELAALPTQLDEFYRSVVDLQCQRYLGIINDHEFYGILNVFFDLAMEEVRPHD